VRRIGPILVAPHPAMLFKQKGRLPSLRRKTGLDFETVKPQGVTGRTTSERELEPQLNVAAAARTDERIAVRDIGGLSHAAEIAGGPQVIAGSNATL